MKKCLPWLTFSAHCKASFTRSDKNHRYHTRGCSCRVFAKIKATRCERRLCGLICLGAKQKPVAPGTVYNRRELNPAVKPCELQQSCDSVHAILCRQRSDHWRISLAAALSGMQSANLWQTTVLVPPIRLRPTWPTNWWASDILQ